MQTRFSELRRWLASYRHRVLALLVLHVVGWLLLGRAVLLPGVPDDDWLALDQWLRTAVFAVVRPEGSLPVTYVDIDDALYRDTWGLPLVTPRDELTTMLTALTAANAALVVVDIDLAWEDADPAFERFLRDYAGDTPLVFIRRLEETPAGLAPFVSPYDATFAANAERLHWAHAYFYSDPDGTLRDWSPWLTVCTDEAATVLPSAAVVALERLGNAAPRSGDPPTACDPAAGAAALPIIYTEDFGFAGGGDGSAADPRGTARTLKAAALLDGSRIDTQTLLAGRVAVIGGSHAAGQDLRLTPVGILPGAVVQANTIMHAAAQLGAGPPSAWRERLTVAVMFLVLAVLSFPAAIVLLAVTTVVSIWTVASFGIFAGVELAALLFVQFRVLVWLAEPCWKPLRENGWRLFLPDYLRGD